MNLLFPVNKTLTVRVADWWRWNHNSEKMWDSWKEPFRAAIPDMVRLLGAESLYEIGCGSGPNLRLLRESMPELKLQGSDINEGYVAWAKEHGLDVELREFPYQVYADVVLSCYVLAYCDPDTVYQMLRDGIQSPHLILMEPWGPGEVQQARTQACPRIHYPWNDVFEDCGWRMWASRPIEGGGALTHLVIATRT